MDENEDLENFLFDYFKTLPSPNQIKHINLFLTFETHTHDWISDHHIRHLVRTDTQILTESYVSFNRDFENLEEGIFERVYTWPISNDLRESVAIQIVSDMVHIVLSEKDMEKFTVSCKVTFHKCRTLYVEEIEIGPSMVPASDRSIESLNSKKMAANEDGSCGSCTICFEDFAVGSEALCMPCSHSFHGDCIREWLKTSHFCPNCRYEMPTN